MHSVKFHNLGNADCILITLENGRKILFDYADMHDPTDQYDLRCDLPKELRDDLDSSDHYEVVAFSHLDRDHYAGATNFFYFEHIQKYQGDVDGKKRIKMKIMWVPAAAITEKLKHEDDIEAKAIQREARERFKAGKGIRVFSRPERLMEWCKANGVDFETRRHLTTDAGKLAPEFNLTDDGVEFFVHSPFGIRQDACTVEDRNTDSLVMQATFEVNKVPTKLMLSADVGHAVLSDIMRVTEARKNDERLEWDIFKLPHHCSYLTLSDDKGKDKTQPVPEVERLFENYSQDRCVVVSTSDTIPIKGDERDTQTGANPPHRQAANYYKEDVVPQRSGEFWATMEYPTAIRPKPLIIDIDESKARIRKTVVTVTAAASMSRPPRAGDHG